MKEPGGPFFVSFRCLSFRICLVLIPFAFLAGCTTRQIRSQNDISPQAHVLIQQLENQNTGLAQFKGLGSYRLINAEGQMSGRMGWACRRPDQFRADILDFGGRPAAAIASDGEHLFARFKGKRKTHKRANSRAALKKILGAPLNSAEIIAFLGGRIPLAPHQTARVKEPSGSGAILTLKGSNDQLVEEIYLNKDTALPERVMVYGESNQVAYEVTLGAPMKQDGYTFYRSVSFRTDSGNRFDLRTTKLWINPDLPTPLFRLNRD